MLMLQGQLMFVCCVDVTGSADGGCDVLMLQCQLMFV